MYITAVKFNADKTACTHYRPNSSFVLATKRLPSMLSDVYQKVIVLDSTNSMLSFALKP